VGRVSVGASLHAVSMCSSRCRTWAQHGARHPDGRRDRPRPDRHPVGLSDREAAGHAQLVHLVRAPQTSPRRGAGLRRFAPKEDLGHSRLLLAAFGRRGLSASSWPRWLEGRGGGPREGQTPNSPCTLGAVRLGGQSPGTRTAVVANELVFPRLRAIAGGWIIPVSAVRSSRRRGAQPPTPRRKSYRRGEDRRC